MEFTGININLDNNGMVTPEFSMPTIPGAVQQVPVQQVPVQQVPVQQVPVQQVPVQQVPVQQVPVQPEQTEIQQVVQEMAAVANTPMPQAPAAVTANNNRVIAEIKSAYFGGFIKILEFLSSGMGSQDLIYIEEGKLNTIKNSGFIFCDLENLFGKNNFEIIDPVNTIKKLKLCRGGDLVSILNDVEDNKYQIVTSSNGAIVDIIKVNKPQAVDPQAVKAPSLGSKRFEMELPLEIVAKLLEAKKAMDANYFTIVLEKATYKLLAIQTTENYEHIFSTTAGEKIELKVFDPFPVTKAEGLIFEVYVDDNKTENNINIQTISDVSITSIRYTEIAQKKTEFDSFAL
jgi:hypothetical protein